MKHTSSLFWFAFRKRPRAVALIGVATVLGCVGGPATATGTREARNAGPREQCPVERQPELSARPAIIHPNERVPDFVLAMEI